MDEASWSNENSSGAKAVDIRINSNSGNKYCDSVFFLRISFFTIPIFIGIYILMFYMRMFISSSEAAIFGKWILIISCLISLSGLFASVLSLMKKEKYISLIILSLALNIIISFFLFFIAIRIFRN